MKKEAHNEPLFFSKLGGHDGRLLFLYFFDFFQKE